MNKRGRSILGLFLFGILIFSIIISCVNLVSAFDTSTISGSFESLFTDWSRGEVPKNIAKIIFAVVITLLIFTILENINLFKNKGVLWVISFLISILATMYLTPEEVYTMLVSYSALGLTLISIIPFLIIAGFTYTAIKSGDPSQFLLQKIAWGMFAAFMVYKSVYFFIYEDYTNASMTILGILVGMTIIALLLFLFNRSITTAFTRQYLEAELRAGGRRAQEAATAIRHLSDFERNISSNSSRDWSI